MSSLFHLPLFSVLQLASIHLVMMLRPGRNSMKLTIIFVSSYHTLSLLSSLSDIDMNFDLAMPNHVRSLRPDTYNYCHCIFSCFACSFQCLFHFLFHNFHNSPLTYIVPFSSLQIISSLVIFRAWTYHFSLPPYTAFYCFPSHR